MLNGLLRNQTDYHEVFLGQRLNHKAVSRLSLQIFFFKKLVGLKQVDSLEGVFRYLFVNWTDFSLRWLENFQWISNG